MNECCADCRGSAPYFVCRRRSCCTCHDWLDTLAKQTPNNLPWADHTANTAIGRTK